MQEAYKIFTLTTITITWWTAFLLLQDKRGNTLLNRWFAAFLLALTTPQLDFYAALMIPGGLSYVSLLASSFLFLKGPFVLMFVRVLTRQSLGLKSILVHFLPWGLAAISLFIFALNPTHFLLLGMCHMLLYLLFSLSKMVQNRRDIAGIWQGFKNSTYYWLLYIMGGLMLLMSVDLFVMTLVISGVLTSFNFLDYFVFPAFSVYALSIGILSVYRPELLFHDVAFDAPNLVETTTESEIEPVEILAPQQSDEQKERYLALDASLAQTLMQQLTALMQVQHLYRESALSLSDLAVSLDISVHQVSELLNVHFGLNFYDYVNGYRLRYACNLLSASGCQLRILDIAYEAGFNNKNSFYRLFKGVLGVTPNQYRSDAVARESQEIWVGG